MTDTIQKLTYDDFGNIVHIDRGGTAADMSYEYDLLHGWVKSIQSAGGFNQTLKREAGGLYNGSIASMSWMMPNDMVERTYHYTYDGLNRLRDGIKIMQQIRLRKRWLLEVVVCMKQPILQKEKPMRLKSQSNQKERIFPLKMRLTI